MRKYIYLQIFVLLLTIPSLTLSQSINLATGKSDEPIEITADNGLEWQRDKQIMIASGNAKATRGTNTVEADKLIAYYKKDPKGVSNLSRIDAIGKLKITSPTQNITGENGVYDLKRAILVVRGKKVTLISNKDKISATQQMEYYEKKEMAVARQNAIARHDGKVLSADTIVALFLKNSSNESQVHRVEAFNNVRVVTKTESVWANKGIHNVISGIVNLYGNVRITRENNQLNGDHAIINLKTGISKLLTDPGAQSADDVLNNKPRQKKRVRGYLVPKLK